MTRGIRLREAGVSDRTQDDILWRASKTMTAHYSMAQIVELHAALEKIKGEPPHWNASLQTLMRQAQHQRARLVNGGKTA